MAEHPAQPFPGRVLDLLGAAGDRAVFEHGERVVSGGALLGMVRRVANGLRHDGIGPGDGVGVLLGVTPEAFAAIIACHVVGARVVGARPGLPAGRLAHVLKDVAVTVSDGAPGPGRTTPLGTLLSAADGPVTPAGLPHDVARLLHTSGSTGVPKAVAQTYAALGSAWTLRPSAWPPAIAALASALDRFLVFGSLTSQVMMEYGLLTLAAGGTMVVADAPAFPDALVRHRATASVITVPRLGKLVARQRTEPADLSCLRALMVSGSPLSPARLREALDVLGPVVFHGYGQTETGTIAMATPHDPAGSVGRPPAGLEVRGPDGAVLPPGVDGELFARTPAQGAAYWADPVGSAEVFVDGWVRTRDIGHLDAAGMLWLTGRARDVVIVNAEVYATGPIERVLAAHPSVAEAHVVAAPDADTGETAHAFVVPAAGHTPDLPALRALVAAALGEPCAPTGLTVLDEVPLTPAGKPDRAGLRARVAG